MTILSMIQAAQQAGISRSTLYRAIRAGRLSVASQPDGSRGVDITELIRVFGPLQADTGQATQSGTSSDISVMRERCTMLEREIEWLRVELSDAKSEKTRLLGMLEQRLLETTKGKCRRGKKKGRK